jgi:hypothetical protein
MSFSVDMNAVTEFNSATDSVYYINEDVGPLNKTSMKDPDGDGIYTVTFSGVPAGIFPTVFAYGLDVDNLTYEWAWATNMGLRVVTLEDMDIDNSYKFGETTGEIEEGVDVTINLNMRDTNFDDATDVLYISGDFNGWAAPGSDTKYKFTKSSPGRYMLTLTNVAEGYYLNDIYWDVAGSEAWGAKGEWSGGPTGIDQMIYVGDENVTMNCDWGKTFNMTFRVNMNGIAEFNSSVDSVYYINQGVGKLNNKSLLDSDGDGIYVVTFEGVPQGYYPTIFAYGSNVDNLTYEWPWSESGKRVVTINNVNIDNTYSFGDINGTPTGTFAKIQDNGTNISLFPNPANNGIINIEANGFVENALLKILNVEGVVVYTNVIQTNSISVIDVSSLTSGVYVVNVSDDKSISIAKLLIR